MFIFRWVVIAIVLGACSTKEYTLFQDEKVSLKEKDQKTTLAEALFPKKRCTVENLPTNVASEVPISFRYVSKILPSDKLKVDIYNKSKKITLQEAVDPQSKIALPAKTDTSDIIVDIDGTVYMPLLGEVKLAGMTEKEAGDYLSRKYRAYLKKPYVKVSITNTRIYVLGEVGKPGVIPIPPSGISLYEVLARSGDFTDHAKRNLVNIISGPLGKQTIRTIDMTTLASINASNLMIRPNSIVYVPPRRMKAVKVAIDDYTPILQLISSSLGTYLSIDYIINGRD